MSKGDFIAGLKKAEALRAGKGVPPATDARVSRALAGPRPAQRWPVLAAFAAAAAGLVVWISSGPRVVDGFEVESGAALKVAEGWQALPEVDRLPRWVDLAQQIRFESSGSFTLRREAEQIRLVEGEVTLDVQPRPSGVTPVRIRVSHGIIEVLGTRFTLIQRRDGGSVTLYRGTIRFLSTDGRSTQLSPTQTLAWPLPPEETTAPVPLPVPPAVTVEPSADLPVKTAPVPPAAAVEPSAARPGKPAVDSGDGLDTLLERIFALRSRGLFREAATELRSALREQRSASDDERLSFELGSILTYQLRAADEACAHWAAHRQRFSPGHYEPEVAGARAALECPTP
jgi:transmembrane sensor